MGATPGCLAAAMLLAATASFPGLAAGQQGGTVCAGKNNLCMHVLGGVASGKRIFYHKNKAENEQLDRGRWRLQPIPAHLIKHDWQKGAYAICADSDTDLCIRGDSNMNTNTRIKSVNPCIPRLHAAPLFAVGGDVCAVARALQLCRSAQVLMAHTLRCCASRRSGGQQAGRCAHAHEPLALATGKTAKQPD